MLLNLVEFCLEKLKLPKDGFIFPACTISPNVVNNLQFKNRKQTHESSDDGTYNQVSNID